MKTQRINEFWFPNWVKIDAKTKYGEFGPMIGKKTEANYVTTESHHLPTAAALNTLTTSKCPNANDEPLDNGILKFKIKRLRPDHMNQ